MKYGSDSTNPYKGLANLSATIIEILCTMLNTASKVAYC